MYILYYIVYTRSQKTRCFSMNVLPTHFALLQLLQKHRTTSLDECDASSRRTCGRRLRRRAGCNRRRHCWTRPPNECLSYHQLPSWRMLGKMMVGLSSECFVWDFFWDWNWKQERTATIRDHQSDAPVFLTIHLFDSVSERPRCVLTSWKHPGLESGPSE